MTSPLPKGMGFLIHRQLDDNSEMLSPLTLSPTANTASPAAFTFSAALMSRSCSVSHSGQTHTRTSSGIDSETNPQQKHRLLEGKNLSISTYTRPAQLALYSSCRVNYPQLASAICFANFGFLIMFFTEKGCKPEPQKILSFGINPISSRHRIRPNIDLLFLPGATSRLSHNSENLPFDRFQSACRRFDPSGRHRR